MDTSLRTRQMVGAWAGMIGSATFVAVFILQDLLHSDYDWVTTAVSAHSIGPHGWIQIASFVVNGMLLFVFAWAVAGAAQKGATSQLGGLFVAIVGLCMVASGPLVMDPPPVAMFSSRSTWHGIAH